MLLLIAQIQEVRPQGLYDLLLRVHQDYQPKKIYITENGASYIDPPDENSAIHDTRQMKMVLSMIPAGWNICALILTPSGGRSARAYLQRDISSGH